jgi:hypothetical protein
MQRTKSFPSSQPVSTITQVIAELEGIIDWSIENNSRIGYFAVLYHRVTCRIKDGIANNEFQDGPRMEKLDVLFALRYIDAWKAWISGQPLTQSWQVAFDASKNGGTVILQQMLLGINAHINLDLGIATSETVGSQGSIENILHDFDTINAILASLVDEVQKDLTQVSPLIRLVDKFGKGRQDKLATFSIDIARTGAWYFSCLVHTCSTTDLPELIAERDASIAKLASSLAKPKSWLLRSFVRIASWFEWRQPKVIIEKLRFVVQQQSGQTFVKRYFSKLISR